MVVSKELCAFSDFPVPDEFPQFLRPSDALAYLHLYAREFSLQDHLRLETDVREIRRASDWDKSGKFWGKEIDHSG
jgi:dimethylaniline monooxygenase (N-oxide forming)